MSFDAQRNYFIAPQNPAEFIERKKKQNLQNDIRLRFVAWAEKFHLWELSKWKEWLLIPLVATFVYVIVTGVKITNRNLGKEKVVVYLTAEDGMLQEIKTTRADLNRLLVYDDPGVDNWITKGRVVKLLQVGGGSSRVCVQASNNRLRCGFADSSLQIKEGDEAYVRDTHMLWWADSRDAGFAADGFLITRGEAERLMVTGEFKIIE